MKSATAVAVMTLVLAGCGPKEPTEAERDLTRAQEQVRAKLKDPGSAQFGYMRAGRPGVICGRVNAKNGLGGYTGSQRFVAVVDVTEVPIDDAGTFLENDENGRMVNGEWTSRQFSREVWARYC